MKKTKVVRKNFGVIPFLVLYIFSCCCVGYFYQYLFTTARVNPYAGILVFIAAIVIAYISFVPALLIYFSFIHRKFIEFSLILYGSIFGLALVYSVEFILRYHPVMYFYIFLHDRLFDAYKINIFYLDYGGFGFLLAGISAAIFGLFPLLAYRLLR